MHRDVPALACQQGQFLRLYRHGEVVVLHAVCLELPDAERAVDVGTQTDEACLDGSDVVALDGNLLVAWRVVVDNGLPRLAVLRELDGVGVNLVHSRLGAGIAVVDDKAVHAVGAFAVEDHFVVGRDVAPLGAGGRGVRHAVDNLAGHLGGVGGAAVADHRLALQHVVDGLHGRGIGIDVEGLGGVVRGAHVVRGSHAEADLAFFLADDGHGLLCEAAAGSQLNAFGECPLVGRGVACAVGCDGDAFANEYIALRRDGVRYSRSRGSRIVYTKLAGLLRLAILHDRLHEHHDVAVGTVALEAGNVEALVAGLSDEHLLSADGLSVDVEVVEVGCPGVLPGDADVASLFAQHTCRGEVVDLDGSRSIVGRQHSDAAQVERKLSAAGLGLDVHAKHVDGLAVQGGEVEAGNRPVAYGCRRAFQDDVGLGGALRRDLCFDGDGVLSLVDDLIGAACGDGNLCLVEANEVVAGRQVAGNLEAGAYVEGIVPVDGNRDAGLLLNPPTPGGQHALHAGVVPVGRACYLSADEAMLAVAHAHVADEGHGGDGRALQHTARYAGPSACGNCRGVGTEVHPHVLVVLEDGLGNGIGRCAVTVACRLEGSLGRVLPNLRLGAEEVERAGVASRLGHGRVQVRCPSRVAFLRQLDTGINLRECLGLRATQL